MTDSKYPPVLVPGHMQDLPKDASGFPLPFFIELSKTGHPFTAVNIDKWYHAFQNKQCWLCGKKLHDQVAFVGTPMNVNHRYFSSLPMHQDCAEYAMQVCPFMVGQDFKRVSHEDEQQLQVVPRPPIFFLGVTKTYEKVPSNDGNWWIKAGEWAEVYWWNFGTRVKLAENSLEA